MIDQILAKVPNAWLMGLPSIEQLVRLYGSIKILAKVLYAYLMGWFGKDPGQGSICLPNGFA